MNLPVIVLKGIVLLPYNDIKLEFDKESSKNIISLAANSYDNNILMINDINNIEENIEISSLPNYGLIASITNIIELPNGNLRVVLSGKKRVGVSKYNEQVIEAEVKINEKTIIDEKEEKILLNKLFKEVDNYSKEVTYASNSILNILKEQTDLDIATDIVSPYLQLEEERMLLYLKENNSKKRLEMILEDIYSALEVFEIEKNIDYKVKNILDNNNKEHILNEKLKIIKEELGEKSLKEDDILYLKEKLDKLNADEKIKKHISLEIKRYEMSAPTSPEGEVIRNYIDWIINLPWNNYSIDNDNLDEVMDKLNESHGELDEVKNRIIEYLAVKQFINNLKAPIICLVGPPGVGKTSLASSIAKAMHRDFVKISVGGINDESEIIGHRRTYIGSSPGKIISSLKKINNSNPVFLIDEIDKMTKTIKADPASTLLSVLDPDQNKYFVDNYLDIEYDLSKVLFILTANYIEDIPEALKDRLEIINLSGYTVYEKLNIAKNYLLPKICKEHGLNKDSIRIKDDEILKIIKKYTKEAGVRELERVLAKIIRKVVCSLAGKRIKSNYITLDSKKINEYLGKEKYISTSRINKSLIGIVNALAYTPYGGEILPVETNCFKGSGKITITGLIGKVMDESSKVALSYIKSNYKKFDIDYNKLIESDIHIHFPAGAISKDGPSAGIAITTALISLFTNKKISNSLSMTGEITLRGEVLAVGGIKEKIMVAHQEGIKKIIIPYSNKNDIELLPDELKENIEFIFVKNYLEVYKEVFNNEKI